jgi:hypothetical protein
LDCSRKVSSGHDDTIEPQSVEDEGEGSVLVVRQLDFVVEGEAGVLSKGRSTLEINNGSRADEDGIEHIET